LSKDGTLYADVEDKDILIQEGETLTFAAKATSGNVDVTVSPIWIEDF